MTNDMGMRGASTLIIRGKVAAYRRVAIRWADFRKTAELAVA